MACKIYISRSQFHFYFVHNGKNALLTHACPLARLSTLHYLIILLLPILFFNHIRLVYLLFTRVNCRAFSHARSSVWRMSAASAIVKKKDNKKKERIERPTRIRTRLEWEGTETCTLWKVKVVRSRSWSSFAACLIAVTWLPCFPAIHV